VSERDARIPLADAPGVGEVRMLELSGHSIGLYRVGDQFCAIANRCPHRGAPLAAAGRVVRGITLDHGIPVRGAQPGLLRCPWHKWDFDIVSGRCLVQPRLRVRRYRVQLEDDHLVISLQHPPRDVAADPPRTGSIGSSL
jgi:nitrite reductase/ring-hydroxylating ferredoxin subunit